MRSPAGVGDSSEVAFGARASPSTRANEAPLLWSCSTRTRIWSSGPVSCCRYRAAATTAPRLIAPCVYSTPPTIRTPAIGRTYDTSTAGKKTLRRYRVWKRVRRAVSSASRLAAIRSPSSRSASTVRAPDAVAATISATSEVAAPSAR